MLTHSCLGVFIQSPCSGQLWRKKEDEEKEEEEVWEDEAQEVQL